MMETILNELERAALDMQASPLVVSQSQRAAAEQVFHHFRKSENAINISQYIMERSQSDFVVFQAVSSMKKRIILDWAIFSQAELDTLRGYLISYVTSKP
eukprot:Sdes_comp24411_c0_seq1m22335